MKHEKLSDIAIIIAGQSPPSSTYNENGEGLPFYQGKADFSEKHPSTRMWCNSSKRKEATARDILMSVRAPVGAVNIATEQSIIGRGLSAIRASPTTFSDYLYFYFKAHEQQIANLGTGSTFKAITQQTLKSLKIPIPEGTPEESLNAQKRIAHLLSQVEALIAQRKQSLQDLDTLLKSVFLDMFGDPIRNEKGWESVPFTKSGKFKSGGTPSKSREDFWKGQFPWVSPKDMKVRFISNSIDHISEKVFLETNLKKIAPNHLLIVVRGMILAHSFPVAINRVEISINQDMKAILPREDLLPVYFLNCLIALTRNTLQLISSAGHGTKKFDTEMMEKLLIPIPPFELQTKFSEVATHVENLKNQYQQNLTKLENLYEALSQKSFKGELDLSSVSLPEELATVHELQADYSQSQTEPKSAKSEPFELTEDSLLKLIGSQAKELDIPTLMSELQDQLTAHLTEDDEEQEAPSVSYEEVSQHLINLLEKRKLTQSYNESENQVLVSLTSA